MGVHPAHDPDAFRALGHDVIDRLADYLAQATQAPPASVRPVLPPHEPAQLYAGLRQDFEQPDTSSLLTLLDTVLKTSIQVHHPRYVGHQISPAAGVGALMDLVNALINNGMAIYEMGQLQTVVEQHMIEWLAGELGFSRTDAGGVLTSGGSLGNLTALLAARQKVAGFDAWDKGSEGGPPLALLVSEQSHYCIARAAKIMGWGEEGVITVATDERLRMDPSALPEALAQAQSRGRKVVAVVASCCTTATGSIDPLPPIADFCEREGLWLHVDGAHGASFVLSQHRSLFAGIERADSVVWDLHKMMLCPALLSAVVFRQGRDAYLSFAQRAQYLFEDDAERGGDIGHRTLECTKRGMGLTLYATLNHLGKRGIANYLDGLVELSQSFAQRVEQSEDFELATAPQLNIVCFRYRPRGEEGDLDALQSRVRQFIVETGSYYLVQAQLPAGKYLRMTLLHPQTSLKDLEDLLDLVRKNFPASAHGA